MRRTAGALDVRAVPDLDSALAEVLAETMAFPGSIGVISADAEAPGLAARLAAAGVPVVSADVHPPTDHDGTERPVTVIAAGLAKGLEFDTVIVVEPAAIVAAEPRGLNRLYVVLTRAVSRLVVVHREPLPAALRQTTTEPFDLDLSAAAG
jgi:hypothetical protein